MNRTRGASLGIGVVGLLVTFVATTPGQYAFGVGPAQFDPYYVALGGFLFLVVWGLWSVLRRDPVRKDA